MAENGTSTTIINLPTALVVSAFISSKLNNRLTLYLYKYSLVEGTAITYENKTHG